ncbi:MULTISPECIES: FtsX-like permease family protein [unclassified Nocardioides]|uniref:FtsX-like permease family protein n=1 Tax=unclassified Nocardioides TaxID=2615069 RepID=UPI003610EF54
MRSLALASLRHRRTAFTATFVSVLLGAALIGAFATLAQTATGDVSDADAETLTIMGIVVGAWGSLIVLFSVASTLAITVRQRAEEIGLLRVVGATPRQARRLVLTEASTVAGVAAVLGALAAWPAGFVLLALLRNGGMVSDDVEFGGGVAALGGAAVLVLATSLVAAAVTARRTTNGPATLAIADARSEAARMPWWRVAIGLVLVAYGAGMAVVTIAVTRHDDDPYAAMSTSGSSSILVGVGLAVLSPVLLRWLSRLCAPAVGRTGVVGWLAAYNTSRRSQLLGGVLAPVIVVTAGAVGVLMLVGIDHRTIGAQATDEGDTINLLNNVVTGMIVLFAAVMVINAFAAVVAGRRQELQRLRLLGATPTQVERSVLVEAGIVAGIGVLLGLVASLATVVPFAVARDEGVVPDGQLWLPPLLVAGAVALTLASARSAVRRLGPLSGAVR